MSTDRARWSSRIALLAIALMVLAIQAAGASSAMAFAVVEAGTSTSVGGQLSRQAGAHPDLTVDLGFSTKDVNGEEVADGNPHDIKVALPPGFVGNASGIEACSTAQLVATNLGLCPTASQIGRVKIELAGNAPGENINLGLYNLETFGTAPAALGFNYFGSVVRLEANLRPGDYGVTTVSVRTTQALALRNVTLEIWGVPGLPSHDAERWETRDESYSTPTPYPGPVLPYLTAPTSCGVSPQTTRVEADSWLEQGNFSGVSFSEDLDGVPYFSEGCERLNFSPTASVEPQSHQASAPSGLEVEIKVPQSENPNGLATADVKDTVVTLPAGVSVSAAAASGQGGCSSAQIDLSGIDAPTCPEDSKLGTVEIKSPLLKQPLDGYVYLAEPHQNPFGSLLAMYIAVQGPGFYIKLPGKIETDPQTGQVVASFRDQPQLPYESVSLKLRGGAGAPLVAPQTCGTYRSKIEMVSWASSKLVILESPMKISEGCNGGGFAPGIKAGTKDPNAGSFSPFTLQVTQGSGESNLSRIDATLPPGLLAKLAGVPLCGDAQAVTGNCPAASQVGTVTVGTGAGPTPLFIPEVGKAPTASYLAGPYQGAPYSLVVKIPAQAGPFDLGTVVQREKLMIDPTTTQVTAESEPLPQILEGIPITYRDVRVEINRNEFTVNPTNCSQFQVTSLLTSATGQTASPKAPFAAANCERLAFKPTLALQMKGQTKRAGNPALTATLKAPPGQANIAATTVILPKTVFIDQRHVSNPCTRVQFAADACPAKSVLGRAVAYSPLLDKPLEGPVYFRSNGGERQLPDLVADLNGQIHVELVGFIDSKKVGKETSLVRTRFASVPDAPVSRFVFKLKGGKRSLIQNSANLCKVRPKAEVKMTGQNGKTNDFEQKIAVKCPKKKSQGKKKS